MGKLSVFSLLSGRGHTKETNDKTLARDVSMKDGRLGTSESSRDAMHLQHSGFSRDAFAEDDEDKGYEEEEEEEGEQRERVEVEWANQDLDESWTDRKEEDDRSVQETAASDVSYLADHTALYYNSPKRGYSSPPRSIRSESPAPKGDAHADQEGTLQSFGVENGNVASEELVKGHLSDPGLYLGREPSFGLSSSPKNSGSPQSSGTHLSRMPNGEELPSYRRSPSLSRTDDAQYFPSPSRSDMVQYSHHHQEEQVSGKGSDSGKEPSLEGHLSDPGCVNRPSGLATCGFSDSGRSYQLEHPVELGYHSQAKLSDGFLSDDEGEKRVQEETTFWQNASPSRFSSSRSEPALIRMPSTPSEPAVAAQEGGSAQSVFPSAGERVPDIPLAGSLQPCSTISLVARTSLVADSTSKPFPIVASKSSPSLVTMGKHPSLDNTQANSSLGSHLTPLAFSLSGTLADSWGTKRKSWWRTLLARTSNSNSTGQLDKLTQAQATVKVMVQSNGTAPAPLKGLSSGRLADPGVASEGSGENGKALLSRPLSEEPFTLSDFTDLHKSAKSTRSRKPELLLPSAGKPLKLKLNLCEQSQHPQMTRVEEWVANISAEEQEALEDWSLPMEIADGKVPFSFLSQAMGQASKSSQERTVLETGKASEWDKESDQARSLVDIDQAHSMSVLRALDRGASTVLLSARNLRVVPSMTSFMYLKKLDLSRNSIVKVAQGLLPRSLHSLDLSHNKITVIEGLRDLSRLRVLNFCNNKLSRIGHGLASCASLQELYLANNKISEAEGLHRLFKLAVLDLSGNRITSTKGLGQLAANYLSMQALDLSGNPIHANLGTEAFRRYATGLLPHLAYLNKQPLRLVAGHEAAIDNIARAALGPPSRSSSRALNNHGSHSYSQQRVLASSGHHGHHHHQHRSSTAAGASAERALGGGVNSSSSKRSHRRRHHSGLDHERASISHGERTHSHHGSRTSSSRMDSGRRQVADYSRRQTHRHASSHVDSRSQFLSVSDMPVELKEVSAVPMAVS